MSTPATMLQCPDCGDVFPVEWVHCPDCCSHCAAEPKPVTVHGLDDQTDDTEQAAIEDRMVAAFIEWALPGVLDFTPEAAS